MKLMFAIILILLAFELGAFCAMKIQLDKIKIDIEKIKKNKIANGIKNQ